MWHKPCRTFHPWCLCIKTRCLAVAVAVTAVTVAEAVTAMFITITITITISVRGVFGGVVAVTAARLASRHAESQIIARMERMELLMACHQLLPSIPSPCSPYPGRYLQHPMRSLGLLKISHMRAQDHPIRSNLHHPMTPFTKARRRWCS